MTYRHAVVVVCVLLAMLASPAVAAQETATPTDNTTEGSSDTAGLGAQLTAFAQSSSAAANESVANGMWQAGFEQSNASDRARLVRDRTGTLEQRLERLRAQNETLRERYEDGDISEPAYVARQSRLSAQIDGLQTAVNDTDAAARQAGVNDSRLGALRQGASELRGPQVAGIARGLGAGPPDHAGPPAGPRGGNGPTGANGGSGMNGPAGAQQGGPMANQTGGGTAEDGPGTNQTAGTSGPADGSDGPAAGGGGGQGPGNSGDRGGSGNGAGGPP